MGLDMFLYRTKALNREEKETVKDLLGENKSEQVFLKSEVAYWRNAHPIDEFLDPDGEGRSIEVNVNTLQDLCNRCKHILTELKLEHAIDDNGLKCTTILNPDLCNEFLPCTWKITDGESYKRMLENTVKQLEDILRDESNYSNDVWFNYESDF